MVSITVEGQDKTRQISDWDIRWDSQRQALKLTCHFPSGKSFYRPLALCRVEPTRETGPVLLAEKGSVVAQPIDNAFVYGERFVAIQYPGSPRLYVKRLADIELSEQTSLKQTSVYQYLLSVAHARVEKSDASKNEIAANVVRQLDKLPARAGTALQAYCTGINAPQESVVDLIYPFGVNESQLTAVERAFEAQVSVVEGPPGTGKTQTILNIIANVLLRGKTIAILSNNNAAVENVYEKLGKFDLGYLVARLGSRQHRELFFSDLPALPSVAPEAVPNMGDLQVTLGELKRLLRAHNQAAELQAEIDEIGIERTRLLQWQEANGFLQTQPWLAKYGLSPRKTSDLLAYLSSLEERRLGLRERIQLWLYFRIFRVAPLADLAQRQSVFHSLQLHYYDKLLHEKQCALTECREALARGNFERLLKTSTADSMAYLKGHLHRSIRAAEDLRSDTYMRNFDAFVQRFPIIASGTHSIVNSIAPGALLDYVIVDEASLQDIVPGILALGCARNAIIVGDSKQLPHIPERLGLSAPALAYDCEKYSLLDSCVAVFERALPRTLLKEHYRCHPRIIQFCNQQFYDNALIPMTRDSGEDALRLIVTAKGNHTRGNRNIRELESVMATLENMQEQSLAQDDHGRGFIAPYRAQVKLSGEYLPQDFVRDTVHKFQGRECSEIIFSTVLDKKRESLSRVDFVDDPHMVNVAVSRAKDRFTLVTGEGVFAASNGPIAALIRYVEYYADGDGVVRAPVVSAFDLLYREYDQSLERLATKLKRDDSQFKSEQIVAQLLREALAEPARQSMTFHAQIALNQVGSARNPALTAREREFLLQGACCDFVVYFKVGKTPIGVIEVDGGSHDATVQKERDALKDSILEKCGLPLLRLRTVESYVEDRLGRFLSQCITRESLPPVVQA
ncbi:AAA domain-containing protein [Pseudomonadota bacterium AL_CKDN230030165-1A_HGKHYDSX7]